MTRGARTSFEETARRETLEETGVEPGSLFSVGFIDSTRSQKRIWTFGGAAPFKKIREETLR